VLYYDTGKNVAVLRTKTKKIEIEDNMRKQAGLSAFLDKKEEPLLHSELDNLELDNSVLTFSTNIYWIIDLADLFAYGLCVEIKSETDEVREYYFIPDEFNQEIAPSPFTESRVQSSRIKSVKLGDVRNQIFQNNNNTETNSGHTTLSQSQVLVSKPLETPKQETQNNNTIKQQQEQLNNDDDSSDTEEYISNPKPFNLKNNPHKVNFDLFDEDFSSPFSGSTNIDQIEVGNIILNSTNVENPFAKEDI